MKVVEILKEFPMSPDGRRNLKVTAEDWIDTHQSELAGIQHLINDGDVDAVEEFLMRATQGDGNLVMAILNQMFDPGDQAFVGQP